MSCWPSPRAPVSDAVKMTFIVVVRDDRAQRAEQDAVQNRGAQQRPKSWPSRAISVRLDEPTSFMNRTESFAVVIIAAGERRGVGDLLLLFRRWSFMLLIARTSRPRRRWPGCRPSRYSLEVVALLAL